MVSPSLLAKGLDELRPGEDDEAVNYFSDLLPRIRQRHGAALGVLEFVQEAGQTVFVPGGWWHGVLNLEDSVAVTQNFCSHANFEAVWRSTRSGRKKMARKWLTLLEVAYPGLAEVARGLNRQDGFDMAPGETKKEDKEEKEREIEKKEKKRKTEGADPRQKLLIIP